MIDLMQMTVSGTEQVFRDMLTQMPDDPENAIENAETEISDLEQNMETRLRSLEVPDVDIQNLSDTLRSITSEMSEALRELLADPTATANATSTLSQLTSQLTALTKDNFQIFIDLMTENVDEFCAARNSNSSNST